MKNACKRLMQDAVECNYHLKVTYTDDNETAYKNGFDVEKAYEATKDCDQGILWIIPTVKTVNGNKEIIRRPLYTHIYPSPYSWAFIVHGNDPDELIADHTTNCFIDRWSNETDYGQSNMSKEFKEKEFLI